MKKIYYLFIFILAFSFFIPKAFAIHDPFNTNFSDYTIGNINGQNDWTSSNGATINESGESKYLHQWLTSATVYSASYDPLTDLNSYTSEWYLGGYFKTTATGSAWRLLLRDDVNSIIFLIEFNEQNSGEISVIAKNYYTEQVEVISLITGINDSNWNLTITNHGNYYTIEAQGGATTPAIVGYSCGGSCSIENFGFSQVGTRTEPSYINLYYMLYSDPSAPPFYMTTPENNSPEIDDTWITVEGVCPINGVNRIGFTNECTGFANIEYTTDCVDNTFSGQFYKSGLSNRLVAREIDSVSEDCVDYDDLVHTIELAGFELIYGYPDEWHYNFDYYFDYDIKIKSPVFTTALVLPLGSTTSDFTFDFEYPSEQLANLNFNIKQYDENGNVLNGTFHNIDLINITDTSNYIVSLTASETQDLHYVVQLTELGEMKRQYPFAIAVSDLDFIYNPDDYDYFFPRLVEMLKTKVVFNYYFSFHDGFYDMFNADYATPNDTDLDITFKSVSADGEYDLDIKIFSASQPQVKYIASKFRPYIVAILWLIFALYVLFRVTRLFSSNE
jgi:hypothetical protein